MFQTLEERLAHYKDLYKEYDHKDYPPKSIKTSILLTENLIILRDRYPEVKVDIVNGQLLLEDKFIYSANSKRWRIKGKGKWYRSKGLDDLINRFIKANQ